MKQKLRGYMPQFVAYLFDPEKSRVTTDSLRKYVSMNGIGFKKNGKQLDIDEDLCKVLVE